MSDTQKIQWDQPLEAVHVDGRVAPVTLFASGPDRQDDYRTNELLMDGLLATDYWTPDGLPSPNVAAQQMKWRLRNVAPKEVEWGPELMQASVVRNGDYIGLTPAKPVIPTRTALEQRMEDLVRRMAKTNGGTMSADYAEARAILAKLEPADGDLLIARKIGIAVARLPELDANEGGYDSHDAVEAALEGIRRGRALERGQ